MTDKILTCAFVNIYNIIEDVSLFHNIDFLICYFGKHTGN